MKDGFVTRPDGGRMYWRRDGDAGGPPLLCLPGLTRNHRDFDPLVAKLGAERAFLRVDLRGRGRSDPGAPEDYTPAVEAGDVLAMLDALEVDRVIVIGTSRGGLIAMLLAAMRPGLLAGAALNDVGPVLEPAGLAEITAAMRGTPERWADWDTATSVLRAGQQESYPDLTDAQWEAFARRLLRDENGVPTRDWDRGLVEATEAALRAMTTDGPPDLWPMFDGLLAQGPVLAMRGALSRVLSAGALAEMQARGAVGVLVRDRGHPPLLDEPTALTAIRRWLRDVDAVHA